MANTCTTDYIFEGEGAQIRALHKDLDTLQRAKPDSKEEGSYVDPSNWLGNIVKKMLGEDPAKISCRGEFNLQEIDNCPYDDEKLTLSLSTSTAWSPCNEIFEKLAEKYDCSLYWIAEEFGLGLFQSNDSEEKYFGDDNIVIEVDGHGLEYFSSEEDAVAYVVGMTGNPNITFDELEDLDDVFVTKLEYVS
jgi:hypothetical protein